MCPLPSAGRRSGLFPVHPSRFTVGEKVYQTFGHQSGGIQIHDRRKRLPQSQDSIEALPLGVKGVRTVGSGVP